MTVLKKLASAQNRRDNEPNKALATRLARQKDHKSIQELRENLGHKDKKIQSDCITVLYEIGYLSPELIEDYVDDFIALTGSKNNRLVWGAMMALSTIAQSKPKEIFRRRNQIFKAIETGSVITKDNGIKALSTVAAVKTEFHHAIFPFLLQHLKNCRAKDIPQHAESVLTCVRPKHQKGFLEILNRRKDELKPAQRKRINKIFKFLGV
jgi:hypothetical protein